MTKQEHDDMFAEMEELKIHVNKTVDGIKEKYFKDGKCLFLMLNRDRGVEGNFNPHYFTFGIDAAGYKD